MIAAQPTHIQLIARLSERGKQLNAQGVWRLTLTFNRVCDTATVALYKAGQPNGPAILHTNVQIRPVAPLPTKAAHARFWEQRHAHLTGLLTLIDQLTDTHPLHSDPVREQDHLIGVNDHA